MVIAIDTPFHIQFNQMLSEATDIVMAIDGLYGAFDRHPEQSTVFPVARLSPSIGTYEMAANGFVVANHTLVVDIMTERNFAPRDVETALPYASLVANALLENPTLNGSVQGLFNLDDRQPIRSRFLSMGWGDVLGVGWRIEADYYMEYGLPFLTPYENDMDIESDFAYMDAIKEVGDLCQTVSGLENAFYLLPETPTIFPFASVFPNTTDSQNEDVTTYRAMHGITVEMHAARNDMPFDMDAIYTIGPRVVETLMRNPKLNDAVDTIGNIDYVFGTLGYGSVSTIGWRLNINDVKQRLSLV